MILKKSDSLLSLSLAGGYIFEMYIYGILSLYVSF